MTLLKRMAAGVPTGSSSGETEERGEPVDTLAELQRNMKDFFKQVR